MRMHKPDAHEKNKDYIYQIRKPQERQGFADAGPETKGGEYHGAPKRWTGRGPVPARHIPWPELFKHHISVVEGHLKMIDMVRKHTVEGTRNWEQICIFIERARTMLGDTKSASRTFVAPPNQREQVPLGSSSASMYPGYSPADHIYGEAAQEFGTYASDAKKRGEEIELPGGVEYQVGQSAPKRRKMSEGEEGMKGSARDSGSGSDGDATTKQTNGATTTTTNGDAQAAGQDGAALFFVDTNAMQVDLPDMQGNLHKSKKAKTEHDGDLPTGDEVEDISAEVEAKIKERREKKKDRKEEKKRKRDSGDSEKPKKKHKHDTIKDEGPANEPVEEIREAVREDDANGETAKKRKKKHRDGEHAKGAKDGEGKKKKRKKTEGGSE